MSIHADDEFNLRLALMSELDDVVPGDELAGLIITRHRRVRRLRFAGVCGLFVVFAGIGIPVGIASTTSGAPAKTALRIGDYTLTLPGQYHASNADAAPCAGAPRPAQSGAQPEAEAAAVTSGVCVVMFLAPSGYTPPRGSTAIVSDHLVVGATGLSRTELGSLVSSGLRPAA